MEMISEDRLKMTIQSSKYAIGELTRKGSIQFITSAHTGAKVINWSDAVATLDEIKKKLTPTLVDLVSDGYSDGEFVYDQAYCPNHDCTHEFEYGTTDWKINYCPDCGQALLWESEDTP